MTGGQDIVSAVSGCRCPYCQQLLSWSDAFETQPTPFGARPDDVAVTCPGCSGRSRIKGGWDHVLRVILLGAAVMAAFAPPTLLSTLAMISVAFAVYPFRLVGLETLHLKNP